jgi:hypothetical protein
MSNITYVELAAPYTKFSQTAFDHLINTSIDCHIDEGPRIEAIIVSAEVSASGHLVELVFNIPIELGPAQHFQLDHIIIPSND